MNTAAVSLIVALTFIVGRFASSVFPPTKIWIESVAFFATWVVIAALVETVSTPNATKVIRSDDSPLRTEINNIMFMLHFYKNGAFLGQTVAYPSLSDPSKQTIRGCMELLNGQTIGSLPPHSVHLPSHIYETMPEDAEIRVAQVLVPARHSIDQ